MAVLVCPRCRRSNPGPAVYCYYDGEALRAGQDGAAHRLPFEFRFPSGRRCQTYDELAQGCQEEWAAARDLLQRGVFTQFLASCGRADLSRAAEEARAQSSGDIALTAFVAALPATRQQMPRLDLQPRRLLLGLIPAGQTRPAKITISNQGQGQLQGTISVTEGQDWFSIEGGRTPHECAVSTQRQQVIALVVKTTGLASGQTYGARLTVVTNGGLVEVPVRLDVAAQPFGRAPFQGVRSQRELAEKMRGQPKAAVPLLESGEVKSWFALNGWTYPVSGPDVKGVAVVQQFFEALGLSKPPPLALVQPEVSLRCRYPVGVSHQLRLETPSRKWVYAEVKSDQPWLRLPSAHVSGPQHANIPLEIDPRLWQGGPHGEAQILVLGNGGQKLTARVRVEVAGLPRARGGGLIGALAAGVILFALVRLALVPFVDFSGRGAAAQTAAARLGFAVDAEAPLARIGGWLQLPWLSILTGTGSVPAAAFDPASSAALPAGEFRHFFVHSFIIHFVLGSAWLALPLGVWLVRRAGGAAGDIGWALVASAVAGVVGAATLASVFLGIELVPHALWALAGSPGGPAALIGWAALAVCCWGGVGAIVFLLGSLLPPLRGLIVVPGQRALAQLFRLCGLRGLADRWGPSPAAKALAF
jgi:hypothetical protein